ncbi:MAG: hypothetical protein ACSLFM_11520 [Tepidiformaceae bacterium]
MSTRFLSTALAVTVAAVVAGCSGAGGDQRMPTATLRPGVLPPGVVAFAGGAPISHQVLAPGEIMTESTARIGSIGSVVPATLVTPLGTPVAPTCDSLVIAYQWRASPRVAADAMSVTVQPEGGRAERLAPGPTGHGVTGCAEFRIENRSSEILTIDLELRGGVRE